jgi:hypothetical protein
MVIPVPVSYATEVFVGMVYVVEAALLPTTVFPASVRTNVYVVPV